jgi:hypothetical protein
MGVEMAAAQASRTVEEIWAHSKMAEEDREMLKYAANEISRVILKQGRSNL